MGKPYYTNAEQISAYQQAGITPPINKKKVDKIMANGLEDVSYSTLANLRIIDEQDAVNRYKWSGLPSGLNGQMVERMLYYKYDLMFFYQPDLEKFYMLPYTLEGKEDEGIDCYGRYINVKAICFGSETDENGKEKKPKTFLAGEVRKVIYDLFSELESKDGEGLINESCVILKDYTQQLSQKALPRSGLQEPILRVMSDLIPFCRTSLIINSGVKGMRVNSEDECEDARLVSKELYKCAKKGEAYVPIVGVQEFQELGGSAPLKSEEYLLALQGLDNYRLSMYGIKTGGLFQKKAHMLEGEEEMNAGHNQFVYQDGLEQRQRFCSMVNAIWGLGIWCEANENVIEPEEILGKTDETTFLDTSNKTKETRGKNNVQ